MRFGFGAVAGLIATLVTTLVLANAGCSSDESSTPVPAAGGSGGAAGAAGTAGKSGGGGSAGTAGTGTGGADSGLGGAAGAGGQGPAGSGGSAGSPAIRIGVVSVLNDASTSGSGYTAIAKFEQYAAEGPCTSTQQDNCELIACFVSADAGVGGPQPSAGVVTIEGGTESVTLNYGSSYYSPVTKATSLWSGGETLTFAAAGADVPAFAEKVPAPKGFTLLGPLLPDPGTELTIDASKGLELEWNGASSDVVIRFEGVFDNQTSESKELRCTFKAGDGKGSVSPLALQSLPQGSTGMFYATAAEATKAAPGGWTLTLEARMVGATEKGETTTRPFKLE